MLSKASSFIVRELSRIRFNNKDFWNHRYEYKLKKGSGPGSRGTLLAYKRKIISQYVDKYSLKSAVDLGCGDIEVIRTLEFETYLGIDISEVIIKRNKKIRPNWDFECSDIITSTIRHKPDLIICLDVLIHQKRRSDYEAIIRVIGKLDGRVIIISGYAQKPVGWNVFFHEPLEVTLTALMPGRAFRKIFEYRDTDLCVSVRDDLQVGC